MMFNNLNQTSAAWHAAYNPMPRIVGAWQLLLLDTMLHCMPARITVTFLTFAA
jgi:hypothetical protein